MLSPPCSRLQSFGSSLLFPLCSRLPSLGMEWTPPLLGGLCLGLRPPCHRVPEGFRLPSGCIVSREARRHSLQGWACTGTLRPHNLGMTSPVGPILFIFWFSFGVGRGVLLSLAACCCCPCGASLLSPPCSRLPSLGVFWFSSRWEWWKPVRQRQTQASSPSALQLSLLECFAEIPPVPWPTLYPSYAMYRRGP